MRLCRGSNRLCGHPRAALSVLLLYAAILAVPSRAEQVTLTIATHYTDDQRAPLTACLRQYQQLHPEITVVHTQVSFRDMLQTIFMARMGGTSPDIYNLSTAWTQQLADSGALAQPPAAIADAVRQAYLPNTVQGMTANGHAWGFPSETDVYMLLYNKRLFARAGIRHPPATQDEWVADAARISKANRQGQLITSGFAFGSSQNQIVAPFLALLYSSGVSFLASDGRSTNLTGPAARQVLSSEVDMFHRQGAVWGTVPYQFPSGSLGMVIVPNWYQKSLHQGLADHFDDTVGVAPIPGGPNWRSVQYGFFWAVDSGTRHPAEAWALLQWLNTAQQPNGRSCVGTMMIALGGLTGNKQDLAASSGELNNSFMRPFVEALFSGRALPQPSIPHANEIESLTSKYLERAMLGVVPVDAALRELDRGIHQILEERE